MGFFEKLKQGLSKTRDDFNNKLSQVFSMGRKIDEEFYEELEELLFRRTWACKQRWNFANGCARLRKNSISERRNPCAALCRRRL